MKKKKRGEIPNRRTNHEFDFFGLAPHTKG